MSEKITRYLDPLSNFGFKHIFGTSSKGSPSSQELLLEFLNVLFHGEKNIVNIFYNDEKQDGRQMFQTYQPLLSLICTDAENESFVLDIEHLEEHNFRNKNREFIAQYFSHLSKKRNSPTYACKDHYMLGFLKFKLIESLEYLHFKDICMMKMESKEVFSGTLGFKFLEFSNFRAEVKDLETDLDKWLYLLKNLHHLDSIPYSFDKPFFIEVFKKAEIAGLTREQLVAYASTIN
jgi:hypothetical protein